MIILGCHTIQNPHILPFLILYRSRGNYKWVLILACMCARTHASVVSNSLQSHGLQLLCLWNFPGKNTGMVCYSLLQGISPTQGLNLGLLYCRQILYHLSHQVLKIKLSFFLPSFKVTINCLINTGRRWQDGQPHEKNVYRY